MNWLLLWVTLMPIAYFFVYSNAADLRGRLHSSATLEMGFIRFHLTFWSESAKLLFHDFCCVHCVWNRERRRHFRVADIRKLARSTIAGGGSLQHRSLGTVTPEFCDDPKNHERIAKEAFESPFAFWLAGSLGMLFSPIHPAFWLSIICLPIVGLIEGTRSVFRKN